VLHALDDAVGGGALRLGEVEGDQLAAGQLHAREGGKPEVAPLQRALGAHQRAILEEDIWPRRALVVLHARVGGRRVAPPVEGAQPTASEEDRLVGAREAVGHPAAERPPDADAILDHHAERLRAVGGVEEEAAVAPGGVEVAQAPAIPDDGRERLLGVLGRPPLRVGADVAPPVVALEALLAGVAGVEDHPASPPAAEVALHVADQFVVGTGRARVCRRQVRLQVGVRAHDDAVAARGIGDGAQRRLHRGERLGPRGAVGVVSQLGNVERFVRRACRGCRGGGRDGKATAHQTDPTERK
jgi:hypothetical protein